MKKGLELFHLHDNEQFYSNTPEIYVFMDFIKKMKVVTYSKTRTFETPPMYANK